jgi:hypothetical protein
MKITSLFGSVYWMLISAQKCATVQASPKRVDAPRTRSVDAIRPTGAVAPNGSYPIVSAYRARTFPTAHSIATFLEVLDWSQ